MTGPCCTLQHHFTMGTPCPLPGQLSCCSWHRLLPWHLLGTGSKHLNIPSALQSCWSSQEKQSMGSGLMHLCGKLSGWDSADGKNILSGTELPAGHRPV